MQRHDKRSTVVKGLHNQRSPQIQCAGGGLGVVQASHLHLPHQEQIIEEPSDSSRPLQALVKVSDVGCFRIIPPEEELPVEVSGIGLLEDVWLSLVEEVVFCCNVGVLILVVGHDPERDGEFGATNGLMTAVEDKWDLLLPIPWLLLGEGEGVPP